MNQDQIGSFDENSIFIAEVFRRDKYRVSLYVPFQSKASKVSVSPTSS
jgi:hypothetical protein